MVNILLNKMDRRHFLKTMLYAGAFLALDPSRLFSKLNDTESLKAGLLAISTPDDNYKQDELVEMIGEYISKHNLDVFMGPEWLFVPKKRLYQAEEKDDLVSKLVKTTEGRNILSVPGTMMWEDERYCYNSAPIIVDGKLLDEYKKRTDGGSISIAKEKNCEKTYCRGIKYGLYSWRNYKIGVEICADHGHLKDHLDKEKISYPDLYMLTSCGMTLGSYSTAVKMNGYALNSDGYYKVSGVSKREKIDKIDNKDSLIDIQSVGKDKYLDLYELLIKKENKITTHINS